jgi:hypothetical protein
MQPGLLQETTGILWAYEASVPVVPWGINESLNPRPVHPDLVLQDLKQHWRSKRLAFNSSSTTTSIESATTFSTESKRIYRVLCEREQPLTFCIWYTGVIWGSWDLSGPSTVSFWSLRWQSFLRHLMSHLTSKMMILLIPFERGLSSENDVCQDSESLLLF